MGSSWKRAYIELTAPDFISEYPAIAARCFPPETRGLLLSDDRYLIRYRPSDGSIEFGFKDDRWHIR